ncbi:MAG: ParA family protein [Cyanobacteriota bacterium]|nr:ParA family protein [Cyanobacteriota bacterium]
MAIVLAFTNNKGGTGKSTLCANCAHITAQQGQRVLLVDLTSQRTASTLLLGEIEDLTEAETVLALLQDPPLRPILELLYESSKGLDVLPSHVGMAQAVSRLAVMTQDSSTLLTDQLRSIQEEYDYIFIDSPGDLNELTRNALTAAQRVIIPSRLNRTDFSCTEVTLRFLASTVMPPPTARVVLNMLDDRYLPGGIWATAHTGQLYQQARHLFADVLSPITIPDSGDLRTAFDRGLTVLEYKPDTVVAQRLQEFVHQEVLCD